MPPVDARSLRRLLADEPFVRELVVADETGSTNDDALRLLDAGAPEGTVVIASSQTAGRGRMGRRWHSAAGVGLYVSVVIRRPGPVEALTRWTIATAVAACRACRTTSGAAIEIEWPNDLVFDGRKIAGTLSEMRSAAGLASGLVLGTGFNVNHTAEDFPPELRASAVSLRMASGGTEQSREHLAASYLTSLGAIADRLAHEAWPEIARAWQALAPGASGRRVVVTTERAGERVPGTTAGLDRDGALLVARDDGGTQRVRMSESVFAEEAR